MPVTLPIEVYEVFEKGFGKEDAKKVLKSLEATIFEATEYKWATTKEELLDAIRKEFVTKDIFEERINTLRIELLGKISELYAKTEKDKTELLGIMEKDKTELLGIMEKDKTELLGIIETTRAEVLSKIEATRIALDRKFTIMFVILFFTIVFLNQNALEFLAKVFGLVR